MGDSSPVTDAPVTAAAEALSAKLGSVRPKVAVVLGSGLGALGNAVDEAVPPQGADRPADGTPFDAYEYRAVCRVSPEWSEHYGRRVYLCKRKSEYGKMVEERVSLDDYGV